VELEGGIGDVFLHVSVLKAAGYVTIPAGSTIRVRLETQSHRLRVVEVLDIDTSTALKGEPAPVKRMAPGVPRKQLTKDQINEIARKYGTEFR